MSITTTTITSPALFSAPPPSLFNTLTSRPKALSILKQTPPFLLKSSINLRATLRNRKVARFSRSSTSDSTSATIVDNPSSSGQSEENGEESAGPKIGSRVRVSVPLKVYHVPKVPEFELTGKVGVLKEYVAVYKGKKVSANLPYKVQFVENVEGRDGPVKFFAHLREDEFEYPD